MMINEEKNLRVFKKYEYSIDEAEINRTVNNYKHPLFHVCEKMIESATHDELLKMMCKLAESNCLDFTHTYYYEYVKSLRKDFPWDKVIITEIYESEKDYDYGCPKISARFEFEGA